MMTAFVGSSRPEGPPKAGDEHQPETKKEREMKVNKSTKECDEYNTSNADAIGLGLMERMEPTDQILAHEKQERDRKAAQFQEAESIQAILRQLDPNADTKVGTVFGVSVYIEKIYTGGGTWSRGSHTGWRMYIGRRYGSNRTWIKIGDGTTLGLNASQREKAMVKINDARAEFDARKRAQDERELRKQRFEQFIVSPQNIKLLQTIGSCTSITSFDADLYHFDNNGSMTYRGETYTIGQWRQIAEMRLRHIDELTQLKSSFKKS